MRARPLVFDRTEPQFVGPKFDFTPARSVRDRKRCTHRAIELMRGMIPGHAQQMAITVDRQAQLWARSRPWYARRLTRKRPHQKATCQTDQQHGCDQRVETSSAAFRLFVRHRRRRLRLNFGQRSELGFVEAKFPNRGLVRELSIRRHEKCRRMRPPSLNQQGDVNGLAELLRQECAIRRRRLEWTWS